MMFNCTHWVRGIPTFVTDINVFTARIQRMGKIMCHRSCGGGGTPVQPQVLPRAEGDRASPQSRLGYLPHPARTGDSL